MLSAAASPSPSRAQGGLVAIIVIDWELYIIRTTINAVRLAIGLATTRSMTWQRAAL
jgi:hypothetical protein